MKTRLYNDYTTAAAALFATSGVLLGVTLLTNRGDMTSAALVLSGTTCFLAGVLLIAFSHEDPPDPRLIAYLPTGAMIAVARLCADLSVTGDACFVPGQRDNRATLIVPEGETVPPLPKEDNSFVLGPEGNGVLLYTSSGPLLSTLSESAGFHMPEHGEEMLPAIRELFCTILEVADAAELHHDEDTVTIGLRRFRLMPGCLAARAESPKVCTMYPCPVCSLAGSLIASASGRTCRLDRTDPDPGDRTLTLFFSYP